MSVTMERDVPVATVTLALSSVSVVFLGRLNVVDVFGMGGLAEFPGLEAGLPVDGDGAQALPDRCYSALDRLPLTAFLRIDEGSRLVAVSRAQR